MKLENQVCSLESAKRLKELGVEQESLFVWVDVFPVFNEKIRLSSRTEFKDRLAVSLLSEEARALVKTFSAYTVGELGELLPEAYGDKPLDKRLEAIKRNDEWHVGYRWYTDAHHTCHKTEAEARALMLIYLLENGLIKPNEQGGKAE